MDVVLDKYKWISFLVFIYDVFIFSNTVEESIQIVDEVLTKLGGADIWTNFKECSFFTGSVTHLCSVIKPVWNKHLIAICFQYSHPTTW